MRCLLPLLLLAALAWAVSGCVPPATSPAPTLPRPTQDVPRLSPTIEVPPPI